ncbi:hypothetical protein BMF94_1111 [Rhodotorula taiwanensis]|uniref:NAD-dependent epimerase/dehydratase domain-containing protein n=1 Tax=Rhodotorula taiwanensis TaxID=741276 RepID=A0A2S5BG98_9BASI|nr:hypothetical protein BMF94_1111 [Rhodotorula taiwanensis]
MLVFVTGAAGFVGTHVVKDLLANGHQVLGLARSEENAAKLRDLGAEVHYGSLDELESLSAGAAKADGVIHLAFKHDWANFVASCELDQRVITALAEPLLGTGKPLVTTSGTLMVKKKPGDDADTPATEETQLPPVQGHPLRRITETTTIGLAPRGVRASVVRLCPTVHGVGDRGIIPMIAGKARENGFVAYLGNSDGVLPGIHVKDAAALFRLAVESAPAGSILHAAAEERVPFKQVLETVAEKVGVPLKQVGPEEVGQLGILAMFLSANNPTSSKKTREVLGWSPREVGLVEDVHTNYTF